MAPTDLPRVLRIPRIGGGDEDLILLHVSSAGRHAHDMKLIGTDNEAVFSGNGRGATGSTRFGITVKHNQTSTLTTKNFSGTQAQWEQTLSAALLGAEETEFTRGVEAVAKVKPETSITITIQKSVEGIKQKYGTIILAHTEDEEISLFDWCALTIQSKESSSSGVAHLNAKLAEKEEEVMKLDEKLAELIKIKSAYEDDLIEKFSILLNEKKLKVRDQQRLLAGANVDRGKLEGVERNRLAERDSPPGPSRTRKRKAATAVKDESDGETDGGFEKMDVDSEVVELDAKPNLVDEYERQTDDERSTADEDSGDEAPAVQLPTRNTNDAKPSARGKASATDEEAVIPPKRDLPFSKKPAPKPAAPVVDGSETESDDEL